ncbi:MAG: CapA family protein [Desulfobacterales bacterium]
MKMRKCICADWGYSGLFETLESLTRAKIKIVGASRNLTEAQATAVIEVPGNGRVIVFAFGLGTSGISSSWGATENRPGVNLLKGLADESLRDIQERVRRVKRKGDIVEAPGSPRG